MNELLIIDTTYLCHRAWHTTGDLSFDDKGTGAIYGVLRDIVALQDTFHTTRCVFAFDHGMSKRFKLLPGYKSTRRLGRDIESEEEREARADFQRQIVTLRSHHLPDMGFQNVLSVPGFEADDLIAALAAGLPETEHGIIVGTDHDLYQCLRDNISIWNPNKKQIYDKAAFVAEWGIQPEQWASVKAYAGCKSDDIPGIRGIGEKYVAKFLRGELKGGTKAHHLLMNNKAVHDENLKLTKLPFPGTPVLDILPDDVTPEKWEMVVISLGMESLLQTPPLAASRKRRGRKHE
jgi:DNA polymerase I